jgi:hypothetical protein
MTVGTNVQPMFPPGFEGHIDKIEPLSPPQSRSETASASPRTPILVRGLSDHVNLVSQKRPVVISRKKIIHNRSVDEEGIDGNFDPIESLLTVDISRLKRRAAELKEGNGKLEREYNELVEIVRNAKRARYSKKIELLERKREQLKAQIEAEKRKLDVDDDSDY